MGKFFRQRRTGRIYHYDRNLKKDPDMFPVFGSFKQGVFIESHPQTELVAQLQKMDDPEEIKEIILKKFEINLTGSDKLIKVKALELARKWEALKERISDMLEEDPDTVSDHNPDVLEDDNPLLKAAQADVQDDGRTEDAEGMKFDPNYRESKDMPMWNKAELKDYLKTEHGVDGRKLNMKNQNDLFLLAQDLDRVREGKP